MNTRDGRVEAVLEGEKDKIEDMIRWCHQGSPASQVTGVRVDWEEHLDEFKDFSVRYFY
jgi:acylphosphatase